MKPLPRIAYQPNKFTKNIVVGGEVSFAPAKSGFTVERLPAGWSEATETAKFKPLTPAEVGPDWVRSKGL